MASTNKRSSTARKTGSKPTSTSRTGQRKTTSNSGKKKNSSRQIHNKKNRKNDNVYFDDVLVIITIALALLLFLSNFNLIGAFGEAFNEIAFGIFGITAYVIPFVLVFCVFIYLANKGNELVFKKIGLSALFSFFLSGMIQLFDYDKNYSFSKYFEISKTEKSGGGFLGGFICKLLCPFIGFWGTLIVLVAILIILFIMITEKLVVTKAIKNGTILINKAVEHHKNKEYFDDDDYEYSYEEETEEDFEPVENKRKAKFYTFTKEDLSNDTLVNDVKPVKASKKTKKKEVVPATDSNCEEIYQTELNNKFNKPDFLQHKEALEIMASNGFKEEYVPDMVNAANSLFEDNENNDFCSAEDNTYVNEICDDSNDFSYQESQDMVSTGYDSSEDLYNSNNTNDDVIREHQVTSTAQPKRNTTVRNTKAVGESSVDVMSGNTSESTNYKFPPLSLLAAPKGGKKQNMSEQQKTAIKLKDTLCSFGVNVTLSDISVGPAVTRFELIPEQGVKVSRITNLADDIKLSLAATDIRIEAPIPGKSAIGIEVPNKENTAVYLRELFEDEKFTSKKNNISFAVGKDISGQTIITDISRMPHLLIAGQTGSGKSVCINTIIMSILYGAHPDDVKLIMIDPKVVELSVYNGIPHLLAPVVTDPKKASGTLAWAVNEMTERYNKFAALGVRDISGYNKRVTSVKDNNLPNFQKMPQIVIIVDELADLMMVAASDVEDSICRLAQMARAAGMYLIIATQRPSVNVITGIIKANIPSRIAFSVTSQVDSRTILDGAGAEKLLGKGDMLFYPSGYPKPVRIQGAFVSDNEVSAVVDFLSKDNQIPNYDQEVITKIDNAAKTSSSSSDDGGKGQGSRDAYYVEAGRYIIEKDKASIGMLQRVYKIGFNRAARIMDQLSEDGVVGPEEGTKPRKILMSLEEFEKFVEECV